ncbi:hypothetical protein HY628_02030 [Candidatus Uhrbacteria bacterium]|nr:hypothetical protein [Candidatus Uhrbacteria bacterium]
MDNTTLVTEKQIERALWITAHKPLFKRIGWGIFIAFDVLTVGYGIYGLVDHFLISWNRNLFLERNLPHLRFSPELIRAAAPQPISPLSPQVFSSGPERYDFLVKLLNPNPDWYAVFRYQFVSGGWRTPEADGFILPGEEKFVGQFAVSQSGFPRQAEFRLTELSWHRVNRRVIRDIPAWMRERFNILVSEVTHTPALTPDRPGGRTSFTLENRSAFGYWQVGFPVVLLRGAVPVAVNYITLDSIEAGERRRVDVPWFETLPAASGVDVRPEVNLFDPDVYMPPRVTSN